MNKIVTDNNTIIFQLEDDKEFIFPKGSIYVKLIPNDTIVFFEKNATRGFFTALVNELEIDGNIYTYEAIEDGALDSILSAVEVDLSDYYTKSEVDEHSETIANVLISHNARMEKLEEIDTANYYTKSEVDSMLTNNEWVGTQAEFDAIAEKDSNITYYIVKED